MCQTRTRQKPPIQQQPVCLWMAFRVQYGSSEQHCLRALCPPACSVGQVQIIVACHGMQGRDCPNAITEGASWRKGLIALVKLSGRRTLHTGTSGKSFGHRRGKTRQLIGRNLSGWKTEDAQADDLCASSVLSCWFIDSYDSKENNHVQETLYSGTHPRAG
jgi:hypothetical protein